MSFLLSKNIEPLLSGFIRGLMRSDFRYLSLGIAAAFVTLRTATAPI